MSLRNRIAKALDPRLKTSAGLSVTNKFITLIIIISLVSAIIETEPDVYVGHEILFSLSELIFTVIFSIEYLIRVWVSTENPQYKSRLQYMLTPSAILDLLTVLLILLTTMGSQGFMLRLARLLRILRIAKLGRYTIAMHTIKEAIMRRRYELIISFGSIPRAMWWSIATLTTVGYGDLYSITTLGKVLAGITAVIGIGLIAIPTGIIAASFSDAIQTMKSKSPMISRNPNFNRKD